MRQVRAAGGVFLGGTLVGGLALAVACGTLGKNSPDADADWNTTGDGGTDSGQPEDPPEDTGDTGGDTGEPPAPACEELAPATWTLVPQDTNGMSTPVQARASVLEGWRTFDHISVRSYEFLNFYRFDHPRPPPGELDLAAQLRKEADGRYTLHLAVVSEVREPQDRPPLNLVLSVDTSGSMGSVDMDLARAVVMGVAGKLDQGDVVSLVSWNQDQYVLLEQHAVTMPYDMQLAMAAGRLESGGATNLSGALIEAYRLAEAAWIPGGLNRVLVVSDGGTNMGQTDVELIRSMAGERGEHGIFLVGVGVGDALDYHDGIMDSITDAGQGPGLFVATPTDVRTVLHDRFEELVDVAALDLSLDLTLPAGFQRVDMEPDPREGTPDVGADSQNLAPGRALVLHQVLATDCPELAGEDAPIQATVRWTEPFTGAPRTATATWTLGELLAGDTALLEKSEAVIAYAEALKQLKQGADLEAAAAGLALARQKLDQARASEPLDPELQEIDRILAALEQGAGG